MVETGTRNVRDTDIVDLSNLFALHSAASFDKQRQLADLVSDLPWHFDVGAGLLSFADKFSWRAQLLGTESTSSQSWLWGWANISNGVTDDLVQSASRLRRYGESEQIRVLTQPELPITEAEGHIFAMIASGYCGARGYYRGPYPGGAVYLLVTDDKFPACTQAALQRIATIFPQMISSFEIDDHRLALRAYLKYYGLEWEQNADRIVVCENGTPNLTAEFDGLNRLTKLSATVTPVKHSAEPHQ